MSDRNYFLGYFSDAEDVMNGFSIPAAERVGMEVLFGYYECEDYSGDAYAIYRRNGKLYIIAGSHCSCNGLEGSWSMEREGDETDTRTIRHHVVEGTLGSEYKDYKTKKKCSVFADELLQCLAEIDAGTI